jgi:hypothetical protein
MKRMVTTLLVASGLAVGFIETRQYVEAHRPQSRPRPHESRLGRFVRKVADRVETPLAARADKGGRRR